MPTQAFQKESHARRQKVDKKWLRVKDKFQISDSAIHEIRMLAQERDTNNVARRPLRELPASLLRHKQQYIYNNEVSVRFSGDGRQVTRNQRIGAVMGTVRNIPKRDTINADTAQLHHTIDEEASVYIYGGFLYKLGMITKPIPVTVQRGDLISKWIGQTTETTRTKINESKGGVMLIDEAYRLAQSDTSKRDVGRESLEELMSVMEGGDPIMITLWGANSVYHLPVVSPG
ncbi:Hypp6699 [Branchiostoma lanceolatum]|uniref:Hypp6699 protein n=1 Tax=Branchiostoma lanceolatum TaxID=7740 RepID=A0A8J9YVD2_BRALA|nr:Hypp6699 [Branchiostoma lanceolatum]